MAKIICGANELDDTRWDGKTISQIREELGPVLNIPDDAVILLNTETVTDGAIPLRAGDELEFVKAVGEKG